MIARDRSRMLGDYLVDLGKLVSEAALEVKRTRDRSSSVSAREFKSGRLMGYNEVISLMQQQAVAFGLSLQDIGLQGIDPDNDLT